MASYHCTVKVGHRGVGRSHAAYVARLEKYEGLVESGEEELLYADHRNMPTWATGNPLDFWEAGDRNERNNGTVYREIEAALPNEVADGDLIEIVRNIARDLLGNIHPYTVGIHRKKSSLARVVQPHMHLMFCEREMDSLNRGPESFFRRYNRVRPELGGAKKAVWGFVSTLRHIRMRVADFQNECLERQGLPGRVDHRSYRDRGIELDPEPHLGPIVIANFSELEIATLLETRAARKKVINAQMAVNKNLNDVEIERVKSEYIRRVNTIRLHSTSNPSSKLAAAYLEAAFAYVGTQENPLDPEIWRKFDAELVPSFSDLGATQSELSAVFMELSPYATFSQLQSSEGSRGYARRLVGLAGAPETKLPREEVIPTPSKNFPDGVIKKTSAVPSRKNHP